MNAFSQESGLPVAVAVKNDGLGAALKSDAGIMSPAIAQVNRVRFPKVYFRFC